MDSVYIWDKNNYTYEIKNVPRGKSWKAKKSRKDAIEKVKIGMFLAIKAAKEMNDTEEVKRLEKRKCELICIIMNSDDYE